MAKSKDAKKTTKKEPLKTPKEKKEEKRQKKNSTSKDWQVVFIGAFLILKQNSLILLY